MAAATAPAPSDKPSSSSSAAATMASATSTVPSSQIPSMAGKQKASANGLSSRVKPTQNDTSKSSATSESTISSRHAHDRLLFLTANFVGHTAHVTVKSGERFAGVFSTASFDQPDYQILLKMSKRISLSTSSDQSQSNGVASTTSDEYVGYGEDHLMTFDLKDIIHLHVPNVVTSSLQPRLANGSGFKTDTDISGNLTIRERDLQRWQPTEDSALDLSVNGGAGGAWDQFETNERLYGVKTDYNENFYTTAIDRSHPTYKQRAAAADRLAREIESTASSNPHVAEERNLKSPSANDEADDNDEEAKFSGVKRDVPVIISSQSNKYTPPARRAPAAHATVPGAPVDPAIISSQLVRPESFSKNAAQSVSSIGNEPNVVEMASSESVKKENEALAFPSEASISEAQQEEDKAVSENESDVNATLESPPTHAKTDSQEANTQTNTSATDATTNVEHRVADAFRNFAAIEKQNYREKQKAKARSEREFRLNDLKKFSQNFKLHTAVPEDILGILAREKPKQVQIIAKAQQQLEEHKAALADKAHNAMLAESPDLARATTDTQTETSAVSGTADRAGPKLPRTTPVLPPGRKPDRNVQHPAANLPGVPRAPGHLAERLMQQQQYQTKRDSRFPQMPTQPLPVPDPRAQPTQLPQAIRPTEINTDVTVSRQSTAPTPTSAASRFNAHALEFKPNPTATTFQPTREGSSTVASQSRDGSRPPKRPVNRVSFFGDKKPRPSSERKSVLDHFNPISRMKKEVAEANKSKDYAANGGIPQAYRTPPVWDAGKGNEEKSYVDMFEQETPSAPSFSPGSYAMAHQHQLPPHLQQGVQGSQPVRTPPQGYRMHPSNHPRDNYFDEHRMHHSPSQQSSVQPSPSMRPTMLAYPQQMGVGHMQPQFIPNAGQLPMGMNANPGTPMRQFSSGPFVNPQGAQMATPMMPSHSSNGQYLSFPMQGQMPMFSPSGQQVFHAGMVAPHTPTPGAGFPSPRPGPQMMVPHGSQQGPGGSPYMMQGHNQQPGPGYYGKQHHPNQMPMRGGVPMMQQNSYGSHMPPQFPTHHRGSVPQMGGATYGYHQMHPNQMMQIPQNQQPPSGQMRRPSDTSDVK